MATYSTKYNIGDEVFVFQPTVGYTNPTLMKTTIKGFCIKTVGVRVGVYYTLRLAREEVPQCFVYSSVEEARQAISIDDCVKQRKF